MSASRPLLRLGAVTAALSLTGAGVAFAAATSSTPASTDGATDSAVVASHANHKHGGQAGHLPGSSKGLTLVGQMRINQDTEGRVADVAVWKDHAYLAAFNDGDCQKGGVYVFDIRDVTAPKQINFIRGGQQQLRRRGRAGAQHRHPGLHRRPAGAQQRDLHRRRQRRRHRPVRRRHQPGRRDQAQDAQVPGQGLRRHLARARARRTRCTARSPGSRASDEAYAVLVDNEESADIDIADITDPRNPKIIAEYDLDEGTVTRGTTTKPSGIPLIADAVKGDSESFLHDMVVKEIGGRQVMLASYWDGGYVTLDVTDPLNADLHRRQRLRFGGRAARGSDGGRAGSRGQRPPGGVQPDERLHPGCRRGLLAGQPDGSYESDGSRLRRQQR